MCIDHNNKNLMIIFADLIIDWNQHLLGWINDGSSEILSFSLELGNTSSIYSELEYAESLTINPEEGFVAVHFENVEFFPLLSLFCNFYEQKYFRKLYWISGSPSLIMSGNWNGESPKSLETSEELTFPRTLNYDVTSNRSCFFLNHQH